MPRDNLELMAIGLGVPRWYPGGDPMGTSDRGLAAITYNAAVRTLLELSTDIEATRLDPELSAIGRAKRIAAKAAERKAAIQKLKEPVEQLRRSANKIRGEFKPLGIGLDTHGHLISAIWQRLPADALEVQGIYGKAIAARDHLTVAAIEAMPSYFENALKPELLAEGRRARIEQEHPAKAQELDDLEGMINDLDRVLATVSSVIDEDAGIPGPDPVKTLAEADLAGERSEQAAGAS